MKVIKRYKEDRGMFYDRHEVDVVEVHLDEKAYKRLCDGVSFDWHKIIGQSSFGGEWEPTWRSVGYEVAEELESIYNRTILRKEKLERILQDA